MFWVDLLPGLKSSDHLASTTPEDAVDLRTERWHGPNTEKKMVAQDMGA